MLLYLASAAGVDGELLQKAERDASIFEYIEFFYNRTRRLSRLDYPSPLADEKRATTLMGPPTA